MKLLVIDIQKGITDSRLFNFDAFIDDTTRIIKAARDNQIEVIYFQHDDGPGTGFSIGDEDFEIAEQVIPKEGEKIFQIFSFSPMMILHILSNIETICLLKTRNDSFLNIASHSQTDTVFPMKFFQLLNRFFCIIHHRKKVHVFRRNHSISQERVPEPVKQWSPERLPNENQRNWIDFPCLNQSQNF